MLLAACPVLADEDSSSDIDWLRHIQRLPPRQDHEHILRERSLAFINVNTRSSEATNRFNVRMDTKLFEWEDRSHTPFTVQWRTNNFMPSSAQPLAESVGRQRA